MLTCVGLQDCNSITNQGLRHLGSLTGLRSLSLKGCRKLTNAGLGILAELTLLTSLNLYGVRRIQAAGLQHLQGLPLLALTLGMSGVKVSAKPSLLGHRNQCTSVLLEDHCLF